MYKVEQISDHHYVIINIITEVHHSYWRDWLVARRIARSLNEAASK